MPFKSEAQRKYLHAKEPDVAEKWEKEAKEKHEAPVQPSTKKSESTKSDKKKD